MSEPGGMGVVQRLLGVYTSPSKTFEDIAARPGWAWLVPVVLVIAAIVTLNLLALPKMDVDQAVKDRMRFVDRFAQNIPAEQRATIEQQTREGIEAEKNPARQALAAVIIFGVVLFVPALYRGIAAAFGRKATYKRLVAGYAYTWMIYLIPTVLTILIVATKSQIDLGELQTARLLKSNLAAFLDFDTTSKPLLAVLSSVDVFDIWGYIVGSISVSKMTDFTRKGSFAVVGAVWGLCIVCKIVAGLFAGMVG